MKKGLVFGKFLPLHKGHIALIEFALQHCDYLSIVVCFTKNEPIDFLTRKRWLHEALDKYSNTEIITFGYDENILPNTSVSSREVSKAWAYAFKDLLPSIDILFTSEQYGEYVAEYMGIQHRAFDQQRAIINISGTDIRNDPFNYWEFIPEHIRSWFVKKIAIVGTESTGKSVLTERLAQFYNTDYVPEMAREIVEETEKCTIEDLRNIAMLQASSIHKKLRKANKLLLVDTDLLITKSYTLFLFQKELIVEHWIEEANRFDLYLFLESDCDFIQDGTRLSEKERARLNDHHKMLFDRHGIFPTSISGNWEERFEKSKQAIEDAFFNKIKSG
jgi:HTH-type transcriptional regulator, transcriptional repressor of NAD biosynthesis genes